MNRFKARIMEKFFTAAFEVSEAAVTALEEVWDEVKLQGDAGLHALSNFILGDVMDVIQAAREDSCALHVEIEFVGVGYRLTSVDDSEPNFDEENRNEFSDFDAEGVRCIKLRHRRDNKGTRLVFRQNVVNPKVVKATIVSEDDFDTLEVWIDLKGRLHIIGDQDFVFFAQAYDGAKFTVSTPWGDKLRINCRVGTWVD